MALDDGGAAPRCMHVCHDANHNGDYHPGGCGNPTCFKYDAATSPPPTPVRDEMCRCPWMTFPGEVQWEYASLSIAGAQPKHGELQRLGLHGWEVCGVRGARLLLKRKLREVPAYAHIPRETD